MRRGKSGEIAAMADQPQASRDVREVRQDAGAKEPDDVREVRREGHRDGSTEDGAQTPDGTLLQLRRISGRVARICFLQEVQEAAKRISPQVDKPRPGHVKGA